MRGRGGWMVLAATGLGAACSQAEAPPEPRDAGVASTEACDRNPAETYVAGLEKASADGRLRVALVDAVPAPPELGDNQWVIRLVDTPEATPPVVEIADGRGNVPVRPPVVDVVDATTRTYKIDKLTLPIPGAWRITLRVGSSDAGVPPASVTFTFCVRG